MTRKSIIEKEKKKNKLLLHFFKKRDILIKERKNKNSLNDILIINEKLQKLPRNSSKTRIRNRCWKTGKPRGYFKFFGLCRNILREFALNCLLPGVIKASW